VTDGNKLVQAKKVSALNISRWFRKVLITHRYGVQHAKPSTYCFEKIRQMERCQYHEMAYIADNPHKDFVGLKPLGILTVRVMTGSHRHIELAPAYEAAQRIDTILDFQPERLFMR
jgi:putative hydrolase of the HAD superfamily